MIHKEGLIYIITEYLKDKEEVIAGNRVVPSPDASGKSASDGKGG